MATRLGEPVRAERRLRRPVCLASIAHRGPCAVTCGRSCASRAARAPPPCRPGEESERLPRPPSG